MTSAPPGFTFRGLYCYRSESDPDAFSYVPGEPTPEVDPRNRPTLTLWTSDQGAILQLGVRWGADLDLQKELGRRIAERFPEIERRRLRLMPVPATIEEVALSLRDGTGVLNDLATVSCSGFPPYTALFHLQLDAEQEAAVIEALSGKLGFLRVTYRGTLPSEVPVAVKISGDVREDLSALQEGTPLASCRDRVDLALASGRLTLSALHPAGVPRQTVEGVEELAKDRAAEVLKRMKEGLGSHEGAERSSLEVRVERTAQGALPIAPSADVGTWFQHGQGRDHVRALPTAGTGDATLVPRPASVRIGFAIAQAPIAFVAVQWGNSQAVLPVSQPAPVTVHGGGEAPLVVTTSYTDGGPRYSVQLPVQGGGEWLLSPQDLGLAEVVLDASARKESGKRLVVDVQYLPSGNGTPDGRSVIFRYGDWVERWYVVTRSQGLAGRLEYDWQETDADGVVTKQPLVTTGQPSITLSATGNASPSPASPTTERR